MRETLHVNAEWTVHVSIIKSVTIVTILVIMYIIVTKYLKVLYKKMAITKKLSFQTVLDSKDSSFRLYYY